MIELAMNGNEKPISVKEIAERQDISDKYLEQIVSVLNSAGFVRSVRGPQGGYLLKNSPNKYTVGMILRLTEGSLSPVPCVEEDASECERKELCVTIRVWKELDNAINGVVDGITLADLVEWQKEAGSDYCI